MTRFRIVGHIAAVTMVGLLCSATVSSQNSTEAIDNRIFREIREHNELMQNLEHLSDDIGPRLTGSDQLRISVDWATGLARGYGLENVHVETWQLAHSWQRDSAKGRILKPISRNLTIAAAGWSTGTAGDVHGSVVYVRAENLKELESYRGQLSGAVVLLQEPLDLTWQAAPPLEAPPPPIQNPEPAPGPNQIADDARFDAQRAKFLKEQGVAAVLQDSDKSYGLLNMVHAGDRFEPSQVAHAMLTHEDYSLIWRLLKKGPVEVELAISNSFSAAPVDAYNTVAEIRGSEKPEEVVILCAHLDSWDVGSGTTDDGAGVVTVFEAMRAIKALGLRPKRTIRMVLFTGEEQGQIGSREYVKRHQSELRKISAVLADDSGAGRLSTIRLNQNFAAHKMVDTVLAPMGELNLIEPGMDRYYGSDYVPFNEIGVPAFATSGTQSDYYRTHHSDADTFDKVRADDIIQAAQVVAGWAYNTAQLPELLPRD